jgi:23S rRNA A2030 N6-methylase RlmJ
MKTFEFNSKATYLAYRSNWTAQYNNLSNQIRELSNDIKETQRANGYAGSMQYQKLKLRAQATAMIEELKEAKMEAQRQYLASKATAPIEMKGCCLMAMA